MNYLKQVYLMVSLAVFAVSYTLFLHPVNAQKSDLTSSQKSSLLSLGIKIVIPSYIPSGFVVTDVKVEPCRPETKRTAKNTCRFGPKYGIIYRNDDNVCFAIEAVGGGIGGVDYEYSFLVETVLFGEVYLKFGEFLGEVKSPSEQQLNSPQNNLFMNWGGDAAFYRLIGADFIRSVYYGERKSNPVSECQNDITPAEAVKIIQSLDWLN
ncbi:MAG: hypothetical protein QNJ68_22865 [Microcoleaceae cyanobacterium MO_207.B10]|nr:hypothetical protein [Microcoleaceae cyanobacterium MO_207.B10]